MNKYLFSYLSLLVFLTTSCFTDTWDTFQQMNYTIYAAGVVNFISEETVSNEVSIIDTEYKFVIFKIATNEQLFSEIAVHGAEEEYYYPSTSVRVVFQSSPILWDTNGQTNLTSFSNFRYENPAGFGKYEHGYIPLKYLIKSNSTITINYSNVTVYTLTSVSEIESQLGRSLSPGYYNSHGALYELSSDAESGGASKIFNVKLAISPATGNNFALSSTMQDFYSNAVLALSNRYFDEGKTLTLWFD